MNMTKALEPHAELIEQRGRRSGHALSSWYQTRVVIENPPAEIANVVMEGSNLMVQCIDCDAWAAILNEAGISCNSPGYDRPCPGPGKHAA